LLRFAENAFMPRHYLPLLLLSALFSSCNNTSVENISAFLSLEETLIASNQTISRSTGLVEASLENMLADPGGHEKAKLFYPKAKAIRQLTKTVENYIEELKSLLKKEAGIMTGDKSSNKGWNSSIIVKDIFSNQGKGVELYGTLLHYDSSMLAVDSNFEKEFGTDILITRPVYNNKSHNNFTKAFFSDISIAAALSVLTKFQNNIYIIENKTVTYLHNKIAFHGFDESFTSYAVLIMQNSSCVLPGENIEVTAGVGQISGACKPVVTVDGRNIPLDESAVATTKFRVPEKPGKYVVPVKVKFIDREGKEQTVTKNIEYKVFDKVQ
jgi:hypothetical protein